MVTFKEQDVFDLLIVFASNAEDDQFSNSVNTLVLELFHLLFRGVKPDSIVADQRTQASQTLAALLASENVVKVAAKQTAPTRHSRFGTSITIQKASRASLTRYCRVLTILTGEPTLEFTQAGGNPWRGRRVA